MMNGYVYRFIDTQGQIIYVGKTISMRRRMAEHFGGMGHLDKKCYKSVARIEYQKHNTESDALTYETYYIAKYSPKYNKVGQSRDKPTLELEEKEWKTYQILKRQVERYEAENGILTWIMLAALAGAVIQFLLR
jgi:excinuclease UvrABC nuclease subunit